jgi:hypothetical protein
MKKFFVVGALLAACGGGKSVRPSGEVTTPEWVTQGTGAFSLEAGKQLHGVGSAFAPDAKSRRQAADAAAQQQLAGGIEAVALALTKMSESPQGDSVATMTRKAASQAAAIRDHWVTPDGQEQSLEVLELGAFKIALQSVDGDEKLKREMTSNAERAFDSLIRQ